MPRYRLRAPHLIAGTWLASGAVVEFEGDPTPDMMPLNAEAMSRIMLMPWANRGWAQPSGPESLPGGRHPDGSPVLLNRPENFGRPMTYFPPQPPRGEIPHGTARETQLPRHPPKHFWAKHPGSVAPGDPLLPYTKG